MGVDKAIAMERAIGVADIRWRGRASAALQWVLHACVYPLVSTQSRCVRASVIETKLSQT